VKSNLGITWDPSPRESDEITREVIKGTKRSHSSLSLDHDSPTKKKPRRSSRQTKAQVCLYSCFARCVEALSHILLVSFLIHLMRVMPESKIFRPVSQTWKRQNNVSIPSSVESHLLLISERMILRLMRARPFKMIHLSWNPLPLQLSHLQCKFSTIYLCLSRQTLTLVISAFSVAQVPITPAPQRLVPTKSGSFIYRISKQPTPAPSSAGSDIGDDNDTFHDCMMGDDAPIPHRAATPRFEGGLATPESTPSRPGSSSNVYQASTFSTSRQTHGPDLREELDKCEALLSQARAREVENLQEVRLHFYTVTFI